MTILFIIKFKFNQPLNINSLLPKLTHLTFGEHFNQPLLHGVLPPNLTNKTEFK